MKKLGLLRLFVCLPLIALMIPNITESFMNSNYHIPLTHFIASAALMAVIGMCTAMIYYLQKRELKMQYKRDKI
jgi:phosphate starvation-inducible membrane PsiE